MKKLKYQLDNWFECKEEMAKLIPAHWEEVALYKDKIELDFWFEKYDQAAKSGEFHVITIRDDHKIVGYYWFMLRPHLHYKNSLTAYTDMFYIHPKYRKGFNGINLFKFFEKTAKEMGAERIITSCKTSLDLSRVFERLKWDKVEYVFSKLLI